LTERQQVATNQRHDEEMARLHVEAARLSADAETSRAQIAEAQARTAEAQARVETLRRQLSKRIPDKQAMVPILREAPPASRLHIAKRIWIQ
jgi:outer membrane protein TolC